MMKKILASVLALCMILACASITISAEEPFYAQSGGTVSYYDGTPTYDWYDASLKDTAGQVYTLDSASDFVGFQMLSNGTAKKADGTTYEKDLFTGDTINLTVDVVINKGDANEWAKTQIVRNDLSDPIVEQKADESLYLWDPICDAQDNMKDSSFQGTFDGKGHYISGVYSYDTRDNGLFGQVIGTVKNFALVNSLIFNAGYLRAKKTIHDNTQGCGSVVDRLLAGGTVENVYSSAYVRGGYATGGIVGFANTSRKINSSTTEKEDVTVKNCVFEGIIDCTNTKQTFGGIIGASDGNNAGYYRNIENCVFAGTILIPTYVETQYGTGTTSVKEAGGIIGTATYLKMSNCINAGVVQYDRTTTNPAIGAITGTYSTANTVSNCYWSENWIKSSTEGFTAYTTGTATTTALPESSVKTNTELAALTIDGFTNNGKYPVPTTVYNMVQKITTVNPPIDLVYVQNTKADTDQTFDVRFVAEISVADCAKYTDVTWSITEKNNSKSFVGSSTKVYSSINAETAAGYTAVEADEGKAFSAFVIRNIPAEGTVVFSVTPGVTGANGAAPGVTYTITFTNGAFVSAVEAAA